MPTALGVRFPPNYTGTPARMSPEDLTIWRRWWPTVTQDAAALYFDVGLGLPDELPDTDDSAQLAGWIRNIQKRADVLIEKSKEVWLIELRFNAQSSAIGRLKLYERLLTDDNPFAKPIRLYLVTNKFDSEVRAVAESLNINYQVA